MCHMMCKACSDSKVICSHTSHTLQASLVTSQNSHSVQDTFVSFKAKHDLEPKYLTELKSDYAPATSISLISSTHILHYLCFLLQTVVFKPDCNHWRWCIQTFKEYQWNVSNFLFLPPYTLLRWSIIVGTFPDAIFQNSTNIWEFFVLDYIIYKN